MIPKASLPEIVAAAMAWHASGRRRDFVRHHPDELERLWTEVPDENGGSTLSSPEVRAYALASRLSHAEAHDELAVARPRLDSPLAEALLHTAEAVRANDAGVHDRALRYGLAGWARAVEAGLEPPPELMAQLSRAAFHDALVSRVYVGTNYVHGVDVSDDLAHVAVAYPDQGVIVFDVATGEQVAWAAGSHDVTLGVAFAPGGQELVYSDQKGLFAWSYRDGAPPRRLVEIERPKRFVFAPDGGRLAVTDSEGGVVCVFAEDGEVAFTVPTLAHDADGRPERVVSLAFRADGRLLAVARNGRVFIIAHDGRADLLADLRCQNCVAAFDRIGKRLWFALEHSSEGHRSYSVGSMSAQGDLLRFEPQWAAPLTDLPPAVTFGAGRFHLLEFDGRLFSVGDDQEMRLGAGRLVPEAPPRGELFTAVDQDGVLSIWRPGRSAWPLPIGDTVIALGFSRDADGGHVLYANPPPEPRPDLPVRLEASAATRLIERARPGEAITTTVGLGYDGSVTVGDARSEGIIAHLTPMESLATAVSPDGRLLVFSDESALGVVDLDTVQPLAAHRFEEERADFAVGFLDGRPGVVRGRDSDSLVFIDALSGQADRVFTTPGLGNAELAWLDGGRLVLSLEGYAVLDLATGELTLRRPLRQFGGNRTHQGLGSDRLMTRGAVWCLTSGMRLADGPTGYSRVAPARSIDGRWLAAAGGGGGWLFDARWLLGLKGDALIDAICSERLGGSAVRASADAVDALVALPANPVAWCRRLLEARRASLD